MYYFCYSIRSSYHVLHLEIFFVYFKLYLRDFLSLWSGSNWEWLVKQSSLKKIVDHIVNHYLTNMFLQATKVVWIPLFALLEVILIRTPLKWKFKYISIHYHCKWLLSEAPNTKAVWSYVFTYSSSWLYCFVFWWFFLGYSLNSFHCKFWFSSIIKFTCIIILPPSSLLWGPTY